MARKYTLNTLVSWRKIKDYEAKELEELGFIDVCYEDRMSIINKSGSNYQFSTDTSRTGWTRCSLTKIEPYKVIYPIENKNCYSMWQCIKKYIEIRSAENEE